MINSVDIYGFMYKENLKYKKVFSGKVIWKLCFRSLHNIIKGHICILKFILYLFIFLLLYIYTLLLLERRFMHNMVFQREALAELWIIY